MKPPTLSASVIAAAILVGTVLGTRASPAFAQSAPESSINGPAPTQAGPPSQPATNPSPAVVHPDSAPHTCDSYLPAGFVFPPSAQTTLVSFHADSAGKVSQVSLYRSSGNSDLDKAALACAPAQGVGKIEASGKPIDVSWFGGVFWGWGIHYFGLSSPAGEPNLCHNYPPIAVRMNQEGAANVTFQIATDGSVKNPVLTKWTGYPVLDKATLECVEAFRFFPVTQDGQPIAIDRVMAINWRMSHPPAGPMVKLAVEDDGSVVLDGERYFDPDTLKAKLAEIASRNPRPGLCELPMAGPAFGWRGMQAMSRSLALMKAAGVPSVAFCSAPFAGMNR